MIAVSVARREHRVALDRGVSGNEDGSHGRTTGRDGRREKLVISLGIMSVGKSGRDSDMILGSFGLVVDSNGPIACQ